MLEGRIRSLKPDRMVLDRGDEIWRPAKLLSVNGASASVRTFIATGFIRTKTVATADLPNAMIGAPFAVRLSSTHPDNCSVAEMRGSHWSANPPRSEAAAASDDGVWPVIPRSITNESLTWWEE